MNIYRTSKQFDATNIDIEFVKQALSLGGKDSCVLAYDVSEFKITNNFGGKFKGSTTSFISISPWNDSYADKYDKVLASIGISAGSFDTEVVIWQDGRIQGYYVCSGNAQYAADPIKWGNLLLKYGYLTIE